MRYRLLFVGVLILCVCSVAAPAAAQTHTLSGTVFGGGSPLPGTLVEALDDGTATVAAQATTDGAGRYSLSLAAGTYDVRVTPPAGSGFGQETVQNLSVTADRTYDVILLAASGSLSGIVRGYGGAPLEGLQIFVYTTNWQVLAQTTTDANGYYSVSVGGGTVIWYAQAPWPPASRPAPSYLYGYRYNVPVNGATTFDVQLPVVKVSGTVTDADGAAIAGATVQLDSNSWGPDVTYSANNNTTTTDGNGHYVIYGFAAGAHGGSSTLTVRPPASVEAGIVSQSGLVFTGDEVRNIVLARPTTLSGTVRGHGGATLSGLQVFVYTSNWQLLGQTTTDANGRYSVPVGDGTVIWYVQSPWPPADRPAPSYFYGYRYNVTISGETQFDVTLPVVKVTGTVTDPAGNAVAGATVELDSNSWGPDTTYSANNNRTTTDGAGRYEIFGFASGAHGGNSTLTVRPPAGSPLAIVSRSSLTFTGDTIQDVVLPQPSAFTGTIRGHGGAPLAGLQVFVYTSNWQVIAQTTTDANGSYNLPIADGTVIFYVQTPWPPAERPAPAYFYAYRYNVVINGATTLDLTLPVVEISGTVTDSNGAPVPGVGLQLDSNAWGPDATYTANNNTVTTDAAGRYRIFGFAAGAHGGSSTLTVRPPAASGFSTISLANLQLTGDLTQRIILQRPDLSPPLIVAGPVVVHLSDTSVSISWTTNEPATSRVEFGIGALTQAIGYTDLATTHVVTLQDLQELSTYNFRVLSTDPVGNGPTVSPIGTFTTQGSPGDVTPPVIIEGPTVVFVDQTTALIEWQTDEPADSRVDYGLTAALGSSVSSAPGRFRTRHSLRLTGLTADTLYHAQVASADPDGNGSSSGTFTFRTLAVPDTAAPVITAGPTVTAVTDTSITIEWTTNEPATSGVSYNDGTEYFVVTDGTLTRSHVLTLSGLRPQTTYSITVSSTDAVGNGPTLGGPVDGTTAATPDTTPPVISNLRVEDISETTAVVRWETDEPASSGVDYGTAPGAPDSTRAGVSRVTSHSLVLTGLADGTLYYFVVRSTDGSGNAAASDESSFKTVSSFIDTPPTAPVLIVPAGPTNAAEIPISWTASTDDLGVTGYEVLRDGVVIASVDGATTSYTDTSAPEGTVVYRVRATDTGALSTTSDAVTLVIDRTPPVVSVPDTVVVDAVGTGAEVAFSASADDAVDGALGAACSPGPGTFGVGATTVRCTARDAAGNTGEASFVVTVRDVTPPSVTVPDDRVVEATSAAGATVTFSASASDTVSGAVAVTCEPASGSRFPLGTTVVSCTASDGAGNTGSATFAVTVVDSTAPAIQSITPSQATLWSPNHQMVALTLAVSVADVVDPSPACRITRIESNEPVNGLGDGDTAPDWTFDGLRFSLRAERAGGGNGRVYTITAVCTDAAGNTSSAATTVSVPKSQSQR
ncbi:MAG TPA: carboxypeptidase regulatory-like domain-containing protein [Vicinamibacterales bacterium]|nr:carboxypeptidase regulatory-like domain-containing protein [Vicinamibacterales bacterium]